MSKVIEFLKAHESETPSKWREKAQWRRENRTWLEWSRHIAIRIIKYMEENDLNQKELAERLEVSPQYVSRLLSGEMNLSLKSLAKIEDALDLHLLFDTETVVA